MSDSSESDSVRLRLEEEAPMMVVRVKGRHCGKVLLIVTLIVTLRCAEMWFALEVVSEFPCISQ